MLSSRRFSSPADHVPMNSSSALPMADSEIVSSPMPASHQQKGRFVERDALATRKLPNAPRQFLIKATEGELIHAMPRSDSPRESE
jgi:hypothetical protein